MEVDLPASLTRCPTQNLDLLVYKRQRWLYLWDIPAKTAKKIHNKQARRTAKDRIGKEKKKKQNKKKEVWLKNLYFEVILDLTTKPEKKSENKKTESFWLVFFQRPRVKNLKSLCCLVRSTGSFKINKGYIRKNSKSV